MSKRVNDEIPFPYESNLVIKECKAFRKNTKVTQTTRKQYFLVDRATVIHF